MQVKIVLVMILLLLAKVQELFIWLQVAEILIIRLEKDGFINIAPLDAEAKFMEKFGWLSGLVATEKDTINKIITDLKERGFLVYSEQYPHVYPHCWRSGDELVFRMVDEWYINMDWRNRIKNVVDQINWIPDWGKDREHEWLDNMGDWMISKKGFGVLHYLFGNLKMVRLWL